MLTVMALGQAPMPPQRPAPPPPAGRPAAPARPAAAPPAPAPPRPAAPPAPPAAVPAAPPPPPPGAPAPPPAGVVAPPPAAPSGGLPGDIPQDEQAAAPRINIESTFPKVSIIKYLGMVWLFAAVGLALVMNHLLVSGENVVNLGLGIGLLGGGVTMGLIAFLNEDWRKWM